MSASATLRRPGPGLVISLLVMAVGLVVIVPSIVKAVSPFVDTFSTSTHFSDEAVRLHLHHGDYRIYERTGTSSGFGNTRFRRVQPVTIRPNDVEVTNAATTQPVATEFDSNSETITRGNRVFTAAVAFHIDQTGDYDVDVRTGFPLEFMVSRSLGDTFRSSAPWIGTGVLGALVFVLGMILLIVGMVRRSRANRAYAPTSQPAFAGGPGYATATWPPRVGAPPAGAPPVGAPAAPPIPGWYKDPADPQRLRYWDGNRWTEHTH